MYVRVDVDSSQVTLEEPGNCTQFHVVAAGQDGQVSAQDLAPHLGAVGSVADDDHLWISIDEVRRMAAGRVPDGWEAEFDGMVAYATSKGWLDDGGTALRAHIET